MLDWVRNKQILYLSQVGWPANNRRKNSYSQFFNKFLYPPMIWNLMEEKLDDGCKSPYSRNFAYAFGALWSEKHGDVCVIVKVCYCMRLTAILGISHEWWVLTLTIPFCEQKLSRGGKIFVKNNCILRAWHFREQINLLIFFLKSRAKSTISNLNLVFSTYLQLISTGI